MYHDIRERGKILPRSKKKKNNNEPKSSVEGGSASPWDPKLIMAVQTLPSYFESWVKARGMVLEDSSVRKVCYLIDDGEDLWTLFCAIINFQCSVTKVLIPMLSSLAHEIKHTCEDSFLTFIRKPQAAQRKLIENFKWTYTNIKNEKIPKQKWHMHRLIKIPHLLCILTKFKNLLTKHESLHVIAKQIYSKHQDVNKAFMQEFIHLFHEPFTCSGCKLCKTDSERKKMTTYVFSRSKIQGSNCAKRYYMFFRWALRDMGFWQFTKDRKELAQLRPAVDMHLQRVSFRLGIINKQEPCLWRVLERVYQFFLAVNPKDPSKCDLPFYILGVQEICVKDIAKCKCLACPLSSVCMARSIRTRFLKLFSLISQLDMKEVK